LGLIFGILTSADPFVKYLDVIGNLDLHDRPLFVAALHDQFGSGKIFGTLNDFCDNYFYAPIEDRHYLAAAHEPEISRGTLAQHLANEEWRSKQLDELEKVRQHALSMPKDYQIETRDASITPTHMQQRGGTRLQFKQRSSSQGFGEFKDALMAYDYIDKGTTPKRLRSVFGLSETYELNGLNDANPQPVYWTGTLYALNRLIKTLRDEDLINVGKYKVWEVVAKCFAKRGMKLTAENLRHPQNTRKKKELDDKQID
jgi:hypothetical protein